MNIFLNTCMQTYSLYLLILYLREHIRPGAHPMIVLNNIITYIRTAPIYTRARAILVNCDSADTFRLSNLSEPVSGGPHLRLLPLATSAPEKKLGKRRVHSTAHAPSALMLDAWHLIKSNRLTGEAALLRHLGSLRGKVRETGSAARLHHLAQLLSEARQLHLHSATPNLFSA